MNLFRKALAKVHQWKCHARRLWPGGPGCFQLLDWFFVVAGVRYAPQNGWQRFGWVLYHVVGYCQISISLVSFVSALISKEDPVMTIWCAIMIVTEAVCLVKHYLLVRFSGDVEELRDFLNGCSYSSGDLEFDETTRKQSQSRSRVLIVAVGTLIMLQQLFCWIPNRQQLRTFYIPPWIWVYFGDTVTIFLQMIYISDFAIFWVSKLFCCTIVSMVLAIRMQAELKILVHHFEGITGDLESLRDQYHDSQQIKQQYWNRLQSLIKMSMNQQNILLSNLNKLQSMIEILFFYIYYFALIALGSAFFIIMSEPLSFIHFVNGVNIMILGLECFALCYLVETFKDIFERITGHMFRLCAHLPYSANHRRDYLEMRTTLAIIAHCSRNIVQFSCPGLSDISMNVFTDMCNISYSVLTFLLNMI